MILIINKCKKNAYALSDMFYFMGVLSVVMTPKEALSEISPIYKAIIIEEPRLLEDKADYVKRLRSGKNIPLFAIDNAFDLNDSWLFDGVIKHGTFASKIYSFISNYLEKHRVTPPGTYELGNINASIFFSSPKCANIHLPFTKSETMILRTLIKTYPTPVNSKTILKYAFRQSRVPDVSNVRTHISIMNKKFREIKGKNIISLSQQKGYQISTEEILEAIKIF